MFLFPGYLIHRFNYTIALSNILTKKYAEIKKDKLSICLSYDNLQISKNSFRANSILAVITFCDRIANK